MVRGRRPRQAAAATKQRTNKMPAFEDPHCASPKRKDCKLDMGVTRKALNAVHITGDLNNDTTNKMLRSQFFTPKSKKTSQRNPPPQHSHQNVAAAITTATNNSVANDIIDLTDETACDQFPKLLTADDNVSIDHSRNLFLQQPVLRLDIDRSPNQNSSIVINKQIETCASFAARPFSNVVVNMFSSTEPHAAHTDTRRSTTTSSSSSSSSSHIDIDALHNSDSNSCDSGFVADRGSDGKGATSSASSTSSSSSSSSSLTSMQTSLAAAIATQSPSGQVVTRSGLNLRPKPATPHRILCPSPVKHALVTDRSTAQGGFAGFKQVDKKRPKRRANAAKALNMNIVDKPIAVRASSKQLQAATDNNGRSTSSSQPQCLAAATLMDNNGHYDDSEDSDKIELLDAAANHSDIMQPPPVAKTCPRIITNGSGPLINGTAKLMSTKTITEYFNLRRSCRRPKKVVQEEHLRDLEKAIREEREEGLEVHTFDGKGRGIVASRPFSKGDFVVEYVGELIDSAEASRREQNYAEDEKAGCYMYYFKHRNQQYCIDATAETGKLGRLVNHSRTGNLMTKIVDYKCRPHLVLLANKDIQTGEELNYDYGDRSKESLIYYPWLAL